MQLQTGFFLRIYMLFELAFHEVEKLFVGFGGFQFIEHKFDSLYFIHRV